MQKLSKGLLALRNRYYTETVRKTLKRVGALPLAKSLFKRLHRLATPDVRRVECVGSAARFHQESVVEHSQIATAYEETAVIETLVDQYRPGDTVWDIGARSSVVLRN